MHATIHHLSVESRPNFPTETYKHLPNMRPSQELLPVLYAGSVVRSTHRRS